MDLHFTYARRRASFTIFVFDGKRQVGGITAVEAYSVMEVGMIEVEHKREGIGTRLYEEAAYYACEQFGKPLASLDWQRSAAADGFWKKQIAKGRATHDAAKGRTTLTCPPPVSLGGFTGWQRRG